MKSDRLRSRLAEVTQTECPLPGGGRTPERHKILADIARENLSLAKLAEAHWDAMAILAEAGRVPEPNALYAVWASEIPGQAIHLQATEDGYWISGEKPFCSGLDLVDRALITVGTPEQHLVEIDLRRHTEHVSVNLGLWKTDAFRSTQTGAITFCQLPLPKDSIVGAPGWYLQRPGFWHGACGPAACWAGGVAGLLDFALKSKRTDPHTLAHLGAMQAAVWGMDSLLTHSGVEIDSMPYDSNAARVRALQLRHLIDQMATETLQRFSRAYGPYPLSMNEETVLRYQEVGLYMRQSHGERDLESLGRLLLPQRPNFEIEDH